MPKVEDAQDGPGRHGSQRLALVEAVLATSPDHFYVFDRAGRYVLASQTGANVLGLTPEEMEGRTWRELGLPAANMVPFEEAVHTVFRTLETLSGQTAFPTASGLHRYEYTLTPLVGIDGLETMVACTVRDVTDRETALEALRRSEERLAEAQAVGHIGSWEWDIQNDEIHWSDELYRIYGLEPQAFEATYENFLANIHPEDRETVNETVQQAYATGEPFEFDHAVVRPDGEVRVLHGRGEVVLDPEGNPKRMLGTAQDITEQWRVEQQLRARARELEAKNEELERFAFVASHDLQEPLRTVALHIQLLRRALPGPLHEDVEAYLATAEGGAKRMHTLLRDLLAFTRIDHEERAFEDVDLEATVEAVTGILQAQAEACDGEITHDALPTVRAEPGMLQLVLQNLVANGLKFHEEGVAPHVHIQAEERPDVWEITVSDDGIGLDPAYAERAFSIFQRFHSQERYPGTGIGLAICRRVVERHGGEISLESAPGEGTRVTFTRPKEGVPSEDPETVLEGAARPGPPTRIPVASFHSS